jgi:SHR-binding domain of vacuolar-sorting associated protein 13
VNAFYEPFYCAVEKTSQDSDNSLSSSCFRVALKVNGGKWAMTSMIPKHGTSHGALRVLKARWPRVHDSSIPDHAAPASATVYELCYAVSPLDGVWGDFSRVMLVTDRFLLRNDSKSVTFEVKQCGSDDKSSVRICPSEKISFHWSSFNLPELISVRPVTSDAKSLTYQWSGGFDPLSIGALPLRIRRRGTVSWPRHESSSSSQVVRSVHVESEIRARTGGTGINLTFQDEDPTGVGALFRIENHSMFTIWFSQDGLLANQGTESCTDGDMVLPSENVVFALDVPFRQGKYQGRKSATPAELLRVRLGLAPLLSQAGVETTKVISLATSGERVRLNPSKLAFLESHLRRSLSRVRVLGVVVNDGPTRVLRFS